VDPAPGERDEDEADLDEQRPTVRRLPQIRDGRQALDRDDGPGDDEHADQGDRDPGEAQKGGAAERWSEWPDDDRQREHPSDPQHRGDQVHPVGDLTE
jgi:hypothetical protein